LLGNSLRRCVGATVGDCVGIFVGLFEGRLLGISLGISVVGATVGARVGRLVGASVGEVEGLRLGSALGVSVGSSLGVSVAHTLFSTLSVVSTPMSLQSVSVACSTRRNTSNMDSNPFGTGFVINWNCYRPEKRLQTLLIAGKTARENA
jgi:hypothetical protein